jgi:hypothetical protein
VKRVAGAWQCMLYPQRRAGSFVGFLAENSSALVASRC